MVLCYLAAPLSVYGTEANKQCEWSMNCNPPNMVNLTAHLDNYTLMGLAEQILHRGTMPNIMSVLKL